VKTHGHARNYEQSPTYRSWACMIYRCSSPSCGSYSRYGAKGVTVCDRWKVFANFLADMGERPTGKFIDRKDNTKGYEPGNCRWATRKEQNQNQRTNDQITFNGETLCLTEWARRLGFSQTTLWNRLHQLKWPVERAFTERKRQ